MFRLAVSFIPFVLAAVVATPAAAKDTASGTVRHADFVYRVVDGLAVARAEGGWTLALSSEPYDRKAIDADGVVDELELEQPRRDRKAMVFELTIGADGRLEQAFTQGPDSGYGTKGAAVSKSLHLDQPAGDRLVGRVDLRDGEDRFDVRFDVAVAPPAPPAPTMEEVRRKFEAENAPAPTAESGLAAGFRADADTAAAAAVLAAHVGAVQDMDGKAFLATLTPDVSGPMAQLADPGIAAMTLGQLVPDYPYRTAVTASERRGDDEMELRFNALFHGRPITGRAPMRRVDGVWRVVDVKRDP